MHVDKLKFFFIILILLLPGMILSASKDYQEYAYEIENTFAGQMFEEFGLLVSGSSNSMHKRVEELGMKFLAHRRATLEEARALHLLVMEKFVQAVNAHDKIQPYLAIQPFSYKRATIIINFDGIKGCNSDGTITYMFNVSDLANTSSRNHIVYYSHDPFKNDNIEELEEPFEEALRINSASPVDPMVHQGNAYEDEMDRLLASFCNEIQDKYELRVWHFGGNWKNGIEDIGATIKLHHSATQEDARHLLVEVVEKLIVAVNSNEKVRPYLKVYPFPVSLLKLNICFEETNEHPLPDVRLEKMTLESGEITYLQKTLLPKEKGDFFRHWKKETLPLESYEEAYQIVKENPKIPKIESNSFFSSLKSWFAYLILFIN